MKKYSSIYLYGTIIILAGLYLMFSKFNSFNSVKYSIGSILIIAAVVAFIAALSSQRKQVQFAYHEIHTLAMMTYGTSVLLFCNSFEQFIYFTAFLFIFYTFSEIIFCTWLFNLSKSVVFKIVIIRVLLGLVVGFATIVAMNFPDTTLQVFGGLFLLIGINLLLYIPILKGSHTKTLENQLPI